MRPLRLTLASSRSALAALLLLGLGACGAPDRPVSVLLITLDTTRADRIGCYGKDDAGTPAIDKLAARGALFERVLAPIPITLPSHTSMMTGSYPPYHGVRDNGLYTVAPELRTLAEEFADSGRRTAAFVSAFPLGATFGLDAGFEVYDDKFSLDEAGRSGLLMERDGAQTSANAALWLEHLGKTESFFTWVHLFDPHFPYEAAPEFRDQFPDDAYQAEIAAADASIAALIKALEDAGRLNDTIVIVTADHGEGLGDHDEQTHALLLYDSTLHVPLVMAGPGIGTSGARIPESASLIDVAPTIAELAGLRDEFNEHSARSLVGLLEGGEDSKGALGAARGIYFESMYPRDHNGWSELVGIESGGWKYVEAPRSLQSAHAEAGRELFEISSDSAELKNRAGSSREKMDALSSRLHALQIALPPTSPFDSSRKLESGDMAALEALGYTDSSADEEALGTTAAALDPRKVIAAVTAMDEMRTFLAQRQFRAAADAQQRVAFADPGGVTSLESEGMLAQALGAPGGPGGRADLERALAAFESAAKILPARRGLHQRQAEVLLLLGEFKDGLLACRRALALAPASSKLLAIEADLTRRLGDKIGEHKARGELDSAAELRAVLDGE